MFVVFHSDSGVEKLGFALQYLTSYGNIKYSQELNSVVLVHIIQSWYMLKLRKNPFIAKMRYKLCKENAMKFSRHFAGDSQSVLNCRVSLIAKCPQGES